jgi:hypothetical protein
MVINSININKTKEGLNSDGHLLHQYQQNKQSSLILTDTKHQKEKKTRRCDIGNLAWDKYS